MQRRQLIAAIPGLFGAALIPSFPAVAGAAETVGTSVAVTDLLGREVRFEKAPERIVVANYILNFLMTGGGDALKKVVALPQDGWEATRTGEYSSSRRPSPRSSVSLRSVATTTTSSTPSAFFLSGPTSFSSTLRNTARTPSASPFSSARA